MRRLSVLMASTLLLLACDDPASPGLDADASADRSSYTVADTVEVSVTNRSDAVLHVLACDGGHPVVTIQRRVDGEWALHDAVGCAGPTFIDVPVQPDASLSFEIVPGIVFDEAGTYRVGFRVTDEPGSASIDHETVFTGPFTFE